MTKIFTLALFLFSFTACNSNEDPEFVEGLDYEVQANRTLSFSNENLSVFLSPDIEDSRCPEGVDCIQAGFVKVDLTVNDGTGSYEFSLASNLNPDGFLRSYEIQNHVITLVDVLPYPSINARVNPNDRLAILNISRK